MSTDVKVVLIKAEETLQTARFGYEDLVSANRQRRMSGVRNLVVFGRSVTFVLQNLKSVVGKDEFNAWYEPIQEGMKSDVVMRYFVTLRNEILKQGKINLSTSASLSMSSGDMTKLGRPPPGAESFFVGDQLGGSGWIVKLNDGSEEKYYVDLPTSMGKVSQHFSDLPVPENDELQKKSIEQLSEYYLEELEKILDSARKTFLGEAVQQTPGKRRIPPYLRVVK